jgi:hypothetical protein
MIEFLRAFIRLRWRLLVNGLRGGRRRDAFEDFSRAAAVALPAIIFLFFAAGSVTLGYIAFHGGRLLGDTDLQPAAALFPARMILFALLLVVTLIPLARSMQGSTLDVTRFLLLPIRQRDLHLVEVIAGLFDPWLVSVLPALALLPLGMATAGRLPPALVALAAGLAFTAVAACLGALLSFAFSWVLKERRRAERVMLAFMLVVMLGGTLPALFVSGSVIGPGGGEERRRGATSVEEFDADLPRWAAALPSETYARAVRSGVEGRPGTAAIAVALLALEAGALFTASSAIHRRLLDSAGVGSRRRGSARRDVRDWRLPLLRPAAIAVASAQVRTAFRSIVCKIAIYGGAPMLLLLSLVLMKTRGAAAPGFIPSWNGPLVAGAGMLFALLTLQPIFMNQLASDRSGLTLQILAPISDLDLLRGKAAGGLILFGAAALPCLLVAILIDPARSPLAWLSVLLGGASIYAWSAPIAAILSILFPKASNLGSLGTSGKAHGASQFLGTLATLLAASVPALIQLVFMRAGGRAASGILLMLIWTLLAAGASLPLLGAAARLLPSRRENLALVAQGR